MRSGRASLVVRNLPDPPPGRVYQVWLKSSAEPPVPAGATFAVRSGTIDIPRSVTASQEVLVTSEPVGGSTSPTRPPLIIARPAPA
jgi:anti-sigma-K factor RskA